MVRPGAEHIAVNAMMTGKGTGKRKRETETVREIWPGAMYTFKDMYPIINDMLPSARILLLKSPSLVLYAFWYKNNLLCAKDYCMKIYTLVINFVFNA